MLNAVRHNLRKALERTKSLSLALLTCVVVCQFGIVLPTFANETFYTDTDNEDNAQSGAADGDMDVLISFGDGNHPIEFDIDTTGASPITSARLVINAFDVDDGPDGSGVGSSNEQDDVYINGVLVGSLIGEEATFSTSTFDVTANVVVGDNLIEIIVDSDVGTSLRVNSGQILINGGAQSAAQNTEAALSNYSISAGVVSLDTQVDFDALNTGNYRVELNFIDPTGNLLNVLSEDFAANAGDAVSRTYNPSYIVFEPDGTYSFETLVFAENAGFDVLQERHTFTFDHLQSIGPILPADPVNSTISSGQTELTADGITSTTITVQGVDVGGNVLTYGGQTVLLSTDAGSITAVTDNNDGTYTATLSSQTTVATATITGTINGEAMTNSVMVDFIPGAASTATSTVDLGAPTLFADGTSTTPLTIQTFDINNNALTQGGYSVTAFTTSGTLSSVSDLGNGSYTAILTASTDVTTATVTANIDGNLIADNASINFITGPASIVTSQLSVSLPEIYADGVTSTDVTLQAIDIGNNPLFVGGDTIVISSNIGSMGAVTDNGDGTYTATLTSTTIAGTANITATINGPLANDTESVSFVDLPTVTPLLTNTPTPLISGTVVEVTGGGFSVTVNGQTYIDLGASSELQVVGNSWTLQIPLSNALAEGTYAVTATVTDAGGQVSSDTTTDELELDLTPPTITIDALADIDGLNTLTYSVTGTCTAVGDTLFLTVSDDSDTSSTTADIVTPSTACADDGAGGGEFDITLDLRSQLDGGITVVAQIDDLAGNQATDTSTTNKDACSPNDDVIVCDTDLDTIPNGIERRYGMKPESNDSDNDQISDEFEFGSDYNNPFDTDNDGTIDALDKDSDNDGIEDEVEAGGITAPAMPVDSDNDGIFDFQDRDSDSDYVPDRIEGNYDIIDPDGDTIPNYLDLDSDGDGLPDAVENGVTQLVDSDGDGVDNAFDPDWTSGTDSNLDEVDDAVGVLDTDLDGFYNLYDVDSDNDGMSDTLETAVTIVDSDSDGIIDEFDVDTLVDPDLNNDGVLDVVILLDSDGDALPDYRDLDSDNDSLSDVVESGGTDTNPQDAMIDDAITNQGQTTTPTDTDNDSIPDYLDLESNNILNDGVSNGLYYDINNHPEVMRVDANGDGIVDDTTDSDGDGIRDSVDETPFDYGSFADYDGDGIANHLDLDDDNDGILDTVEGSGLVDTDQDGWSDSIDLDSDNDGLTDLLESQALLTDANNDGVIDSFTDTDSDGVDDNVVQSYLPANSDADSIPDFRDVDSDNDGIFDLVEVNLPSVDFADLDSNSDGRVDNIVNRGAVRTFYSAIDTDEDTQPDYIDVDSDGDGLLDSEENGDFDGDGENDRLVALGGDLETASQGAGAAGIEQILWLVLCVLVMRRLARKK